MCAHITKIHVIICLPKNAHMSEIKSLIKSIAQDLQGKMFY